MKGLIGEGTEFKRIRRITGYLVGDLSRFNTAKRYEEKERVKHTFSSQVIHFQNSNVELKQAQ